MQFQAELGAEVFVPGMVPYSFPLIARQSRGSTGKK